jgi:hypothetical protein
MEVCLVCSTVEVVDGSTLTILTLSLLMSCLYGAPYKARDFNVVYIWTYVLQR